MTTMPATASGGFPKLSFAKVAAASMPKDKPSVTTAARPAAVPTSERRDQNAVAIAAPATGQSDSAAVPDAMFETKASDAALKEACPADVSAKEGKSTAGAAAPERNRKIIEDLKNPSHQRKMPSLMVNGAGFTSTERTSKTTTQTTSDEVSQKADSSSELGTKPPSLDGKSITSGTTFALDEKESIRPDDSASVKAAEEDDSFSIRCSLMGGIPSSRMGSELAGRFRGIQIGDMPLRNIVAVNMTNAVNGIVTPQSVISEKAHPLPDAKLPLVPIASAPEGQTPNCFYSQYPDEKLIEAMAIHKDRYFLLKMEEQVIHFVQDSKDPFIDLQSSNSFCRMLTHKLADYYHMTHSYEAALSAVRIYRTPFCRIPPSLSTIAGTPSSSSSQAAQVLPRKIMRRGEHDKTAGGSAAPSKPTSEAGSDSKDKAGGKEKLTREQREEAYKLARAEIFGSSEKADPSTPGDDDGTGMSRASSVSAKDRSNQLGKKKGGKRREHAESFDTRNHYVMINGVNQPWPPAQPMQYLPAGAGQYDGQCQPPYHGVLQPVYGPNQSYPTMASEHGFMLPYNGMPTCPMQSAGLRHQPYPPQPAVQQPYQQHQHQRYPSQSAGSNAVAMAAASYVGAPFANIPQPGWQSQGPHISPHGPPCPQSFSQSPYQAQTVPVPPAPGHGVPYAYGQLPVSANPYDAKSQHPIPGSYSRQPFNPKTQSFVPSGSALPMQSSSMPYGSVSPHHGSPQFSALHMNYSNGYPPPALPPAVPHSVAPSLPPHTPHAMQPLMPPACGATGGSYPMAPQSSNLSHSSLSAYHPAQIPLPPRPPPQQQPASSRSSSGSIKPTGGKPPYSNVHGIPAKPPAVHGHLPMYGNPATLPQKPPT